MEVSVTNVAIFAAVGAILAVFALFRVVSNSKKYVDAPPVWSGGWPLIGHFARFAGSPVGTIKEGYAACGPVFTMTIFGKRITFLIGSEADAPFYRANDDELSQNEPYKFMTPIFGKGIVFDAPLAVKNQQLRFVSSALKTTALRTYIPQIIAEADAYFASWGNEGTVDLLDCMARLTILTASRCLLGPEVREQLFENVAALLHDIDEGINPIAIFYPNAPLPAMWKRDAARKALREIFGRVINNRRERGIRHDDMLQAFMEAEYKDGSRCDDDQITGLLIGTLFAGQHTSSITSTWTALNILHHPEVKARIMAEQVAVLGSDASSTASLNFDTLNALDEMHRCMKESLRQAPPLIMLMREVHVPLAVKGARNQRYVVPVGDLVFAVPAVSMNLPDSAEDCVFKNARKFDPDRFKAPRNEDKARPFAYTAFGGGMHGCLGEQFGFLQVKTIVSLLLRRFEIEPLDPLPEPNYKVMVVGRECCATYEEACKPTTIRYKKRTVPLGSALQA